MMAPVSRLSHAWFFRCQYVRTWVAGDFREDAFARQRHRCIDPTVNFQLVATLHQSACAPHSCSPRESLSQSTLQSREKYFGSQTRRSSAVDISIPRAHQVSVRLHPWRPNQEAPRSSSGACGTIKGKERAKGCTIVTAPLRTGRHRLQVETDSILQSVEEQARVNTRRWRESEERARGVAGRPERPIK